MAAFTAVATALAITSIASAGINAVGARQERKAAEKSANAQIEAAKIAANAPIEQQKQAQTTAREQLRAAQAKRTQTVYTSPLGVQNQAAVNQKSLLGQ